MINLKKFVPNASIFNITDGDIDGGILFDKSGKNMFDVLFLFHSEYVTQVEYESLKNFVYNGGTLVPLDGNVFYAQVKYNKNDCNVTLVKGHDWDFTDGRIAIKSNSEHYFDENRYFIGSNFIVNDIHDDVRFGNNPFNYTHFEENYVNNKNASILLDYHVSLPEDRSKSVTTKTTEGKMIATYELKFGEGKVIMLGLYGQHLANSTSFFEFFDKIIIPRALGIKYELGSNQTTTDDIFWKSDYWTIFKVVTQPISKTVIIYLNDSRNKDIVGKNANLTITIPKTLIGLNATFSQDLEVTSDGRAIPFLPMVSDDVEIGLKLSIPIQTKQLKIAPIQVSQNQSNNNT